MGSTGPDTRLLFSALDHLAATSPSQPFCIHPVSSDLSLGWREITMEQMAGAVDYMAHWIDRNIVAASKSSGPETFAYMGANDVRYGMFVLACMKMGHTSLLLSPRNSVQASLHILEKAGCSKFVYSIERERPVRALQNSDARIQAWQVPGLWEVFDDSTGIEYPARERNFEDIQNDTAIIIHSSGTTGLPRPVPLTYKYFEITINLKSLPKPPGRSITVYSVTEPGKLLLTISPFFHFMGLATLFASIAHDTPFVLGPERPLTAELLAQIVNDTDAKTTTLPPSILEDISSSKLGLDTLGKFDFIASGSAPMSTEVGDTISKVTHLQTVLGSSECGIVVSLRAENREDWEYMEWNPFYATDMQNVGDGCFELVIPKTASRDTHCIFHTCPGIEEYRTGDLFVPHPKKPGLWKYAGRKDDLIVLNNGEKFNPTAMEGIIQGHPLISRALVLGQGRFQAALLVEPQWDKLNDGIQRDELIEQIWPTVQEANETAPGHARVMRSKIAIASQEKPFKITAKGSTQRHTTVADYAQEIEELYSQSDEDEVVAIEIPTDPTAEHVATSVRNVLLQLLPVEKIDDESDIFALGLDSLQTLHLGNILRSAVRRIRPELNSQAFSGQQLYTHPSISKLSQYILGIIRGDDTAIGLGATPEEEEKARTASLDALVEKYSLGMGESHSVILTGSTGSLGSYLLHELLQDPTVKKVYCLNRSTDAESRQVQGFQEKGLSSAEAFGTRVEFYQATLSNENLGLPHEVYNRLLGSVDTIIHNTWKVNFNHRVHAFEDPHIIGVRKLIDFSLASAHRAHIHFISSISTVSGWNVVKRGPSIPEVIFEDTDVILPYSGYGESKHVAERLCALASARCDVPTSVYRVGQIGGPTTEQGMWNKQEWVPSLIATSKTLKLIPTSLGNAKVDWIPVDTIARVITEIIHSRRNDTRATERCAAFHLVNPTIAEWSSLVPAIKKHFPFIEPVEPSKWLAALETSNKNATPSDLLDKPGLKILDFFRGVFHPAAAGVDGEGMVVALVIETGKTVEASQTMRQLKPIDEEIMDTWMRQWRF